jgi:hypothetical protein
MAESPEGAEGAVVLVMHIVDVVYVVAVVNVVVVVVIGHSVVLIAFDVRGGVMGGVGDGGHLRGFV